MDRLLRRISFLESDQKLRRQREDEVSKVLEKLKAPVLDMTMTIQSLNDRNAKQSE